MIFPITPSHTGTRTSATPDSNCQINAIPEKRVPFLESIFPFQAGYLPQAATRIMLAVEYGDLGPQFVTGSILPSL